jgi:hypothetical protein
LHACDEEDGQPDEDEKQFDFDDEDDEVQEMTGSEMFFEPEEPEHLKETMNEDVDEDCICIKCGDEVLEPSKMLSIKPILDKKRFSPHLLPCYVHMINQMAVMLNEHKTQFYTSDDVKVRATLCQCLNDFYHFRHDLYMMVFVYLLKNNSSLSTDVK